MPKSDDVLQFLFDVFVFQIFLIGYADTAIGWGFVVMVVGTWLD